MADAAKPCIGTRGKVLDVLRLTIWDLPCVDKGMASAGGNGNDLIICRINPLLSAKVSRRLVGMSQRVFDHREKFRGFEASGPNLRFPFALVSKRSVH